MQLYNTLTRQKEEFKPKDSPHVRLYCCGPTVYHYAHVGNLRTYIFEDLLRRVLEFNGYEVNHVMNITDVGHLTSDGDEGEDKMKKGAEREQKTVWEIAEHYTQAFLEDMDRLNLLQPTLKPKATDHIPEMIAQIQQLEKNGFTYTGENGNVYYDTSKLEDYGKLAQLEKQELQAGARIEVDANKKNPTDFVLWFVSSKHGDQEMQWESPWGRGFPGWHIECSAMASKYLGDHIDIHCGGIDHIPVHHTNEIAQAEGATGKKPWVKVWMHGEFLVLSEFDCINCGNEDQDKFEMSEDGKWRKCLVCGDIVEGEQSQTSGPAYIPNQQECEHCKYMNDFEDREKDNFTRNGFKAICKNCKKVFNATSRTIGWKMSKSKNNFITLQNLINEGYDALDYRYFCLQTHYRKFMGFSWWALTGSRTALRRMKEKVSHLGEEEGRVNPQYLERFTKLVSDDLNLPQALAWAWELLDDKTIDKKDKLSTIVHFDRVLGLKLNEKERLELPPQIVQWILERNEARKQKDWGKADAIREKIETSGTWQVKDGPGGTEVMKR